MTAGVFEISVTPLAPNVNRGVVSYFFPLSSARDEKRKLSITTTTLYLVRVNQNYAK